MLILLPQTYAIDTEFMVGDVFLVAPALTEGSTNRTVYIPEGSWTHAWSSVVYTASSSGLSLQLPVGKVEVKT